jgi:hypothetical protein
MSIGPEKGPEMIENYQKSLRALTILSRLAYKNKIERTPPLLAPYLTLPPPPRLEPETNPVLRWPSVQVIWTRSLKKKL